jgi:hypothetical protein
MEADAALPLADLRNRAADLHRAGNRDAARAAYAAYLARVPDDGGTWSNFGALLRQEGQHDLSLRAQERAYALLPETGSVLNNLANILGETGQNERALAIRRKAVALLPDESMQKAMLGKALRSLGRYDEAVAWLLAARVAHPECTETSIQLALAQLAAGRYADGFRSYDIRWKTDELRPRKIDLPKWDGAMLDGQTILVLPEQGFGDAVTFARFLPALRRFNPARVLLKCEKPLLRLLTEVVGADWVGPDPDLGAVDVWTNMMDLPPLHFDLSKDVPPPTRLTVPDDSRARARTIVAPFQSRFKIGVVWCGSVTYRGNAFRSFSHRSFHRLLDLPGMQLFSLYKGPELAAFQADGTAGFIVDAGSTDRDFADCAATMEEMDLIITSDTATAHIAGSLGRPVWTLLHWDAFWLWQHFGDKTPWYPSMDLIRQQQPRDWDGVFDQVHAQLAARLGAT